MVSKPKSPPLRRPRYMTAPELKKAGVTITDTRKGVVLTCDKCGATWRPLARLGFDGPSRNLHGYWRCPQGCNAGAKR